MRNVRGGSILLLLAASSALASGPNLKLAEAKQLLEDLELASAAKALDAAAAVPANDRATVLEILELRGVTWATLGKPEKARDAFRALLLLDGEHKLSGTQPPRVRTPFYEAKEWALSRGATTLEGSANVSATQVDSLTVRVSGDVLKLGRAVLFHVETGSRPLGQLVDLGKDGVATVKVGSPRARWSADLLGENDAVLVQLAARDESGLKPLSSDVPLVTPTTRVLDDSGPKTSAALAATAPEAPAGWMRPAGIGLMAGGLAAVAVGGSFGAQVLDAQNKLNNAARTPSGTVTGLTQRDAARLDAQSRAAAPVANGLFAVGAVMAATGIALFVLGAPTEPVRVTPAPRGLTVSGQF